jgi:leukotriene-A4 hydrolase
MSTDTDPTTQANYTQIYSTHISLDWNVDFDKKFISGFAEHDLTVKEDGVKEVMYDSFFIIHFV